MDILFLIDLCSFGGDNIFWSLTQHHLKMNKYSIWWNVLRPKIMWFGNVDVSLSPECMKCENGANQRSEKIKNKRIWCCFMSQSRFSWCQEELAKASIYMDSMTILQHWNTRLTLEHIHFFNFFSSACLFFVLERSRDPLCVWCSGLRSLSEHIRAWH